MPDEFLFLDYNTRGIFAYKRASDALMRIPPIGISHPVAETLFDDARDALEDVGRFNDVLFTELDVDRFFFSVRPYYKPYRVGRPSTAARTRATSRGSTRSTCSSGCAAGNDPYYSQLLVEKMLFMRPERPASLRDCMRRRDFLDQFLDALEASRDATWFQRNAAAFLRVCEAHGRVAAQHHDQLVTRFIEQPSVTLDESKLAQVTASGPPLPVLLQALEVLRDLEARGATRRHRVSARGHRAAARGARVTARRLGGVTDTSRTAGLRPSTRNPYAHRRDFSRV